MAPTAPPCYTLERDGFWSRTWSLRCAGTPIGTLRMSAWGSGATVSLSAGDTWRIEVRGFVRRETEVVSQATGRPLAHMQGKDGVIVGGPSVRWGNLRSRGAWGFTRPDGVVVARFSRPRGFTGHAIEVEALTGDAHLDLVCVVLGCHKRLLQQRAAAVASTGAVGAVSAGP